MTSKPNVQVFQRDYLEKLHVYRSSSVTTWKNCMCTTSSAERAIDDSATHTVAGAHLGGFHERHFFQRLFVHGPPSSKDQALARFLFTSIPARQILNTQRNLCYRRDWSSDSLLISFPTSVSTRTRCREFQDELRCVQRG